MRKHILALLLPFTALAQVQVGNTLMGSDNAYLGSFGVISDDGQVLAVAAFGLSSNQTGIRIFKDTPSGWQQQGNDLLGRDLAAANEVRSVALSADGNTVAFSFPYDNYDTGYVTVYENQSGVWSQVGNAIEGDTISALSGDKIALSADGSILAVSERCWVGNCSGQVKVYQNTAGVWTQMGSAIVRNGDHGKCSIDLSADGTRLLIGTENSNGSGTAFGKVKVYHYVSGDWAVQGYPVAGQASTYSGIGGALSQDGQTVAFAVEGYFNVGYRKSVQVYRHNSGMWSKIGQSVLGDDMYDRMGESLSLSADGSVLAVGATYENNEGKFFPYVRAYQLLNGSWVQAGNDIKGEELYDRTGMFVSLSADGTRVAVGAPNFNGNGSVENPGQVRVFDLSGVLSSDVFVTLRTAVYPNPATDVVYIELKDGLMLEEVVVYNSLGQEVRKTNSSTVQTAGLAPGIYYAVITTDRGRASHKIVVK